MKRNDSFLIFCSISIIVIFLVFGIKIIIKETEASFGGLTGSFGNGTKVTYHSNFPDSEMEPKFYEYEGANSYKILSNMFLVPSGYEFSGWSFYSAGPVLYNENQYINVTFDIDLYAIWREIVVDNLRYGDVNLNGIIDDGDYKLIEQYILDNSSLSGQSVINADVNIDGKVDAVDFDIIRQVCLGTEGYIGYLPDKPVLIYELYEKEDINDSNEDMNNENNSSSGVIGGGTGNGNVGTGTGSANNSGVSKPGNSSTNSNKKPPLNQESETNNEVFEKEDKYIFKFIYNGVEYAKTECLVLEDKSCMLVLPNTIPTKKYSKFDGWGVDEECSKKIIKDSISVNSDYTYYACFSDIVEVSTKKRNSLGEWIIVVFIWILAVLGICKVVVNFMKKSN